MRDMCTSAEQEIQGSRVFLQPAPCTLPQILHCLLELELGPGSELSKSVTLATTGLVVCIISLPDAALQSTKVPWVMPSWLHILVHYTFVFVHSQQCFQVWIPTKHLCPASILLLLCGILSSQYSFIRTRPGGRALTTVKMPLTGDLQRCHSTHLLPQHSKTNLDAAC